MLTRRLLALTSAALAACGSVDDKPKCATSASCAAGHYCAVTPDGNVCWPDAAPPQLASVSVACDATPCVRDAKLTVQVSATDDAELAAVEVSLDLDATRWVALSKAGNVWTGQLALREWGFPYFTQPVVATARARDGARNVVTQAAAGVSVTRLRWAVEAKAGSTSALSPPAVQTDGTIVVGNANHELLFLTPAGTAAEDPLVIGGGAITSIAVGDKAIWVGSDDGNVRAAEVERKAVVPGVFVNVEGPILGGLAVHTLGAEEWAFAGGQGARLGAAGSTAGDDPKTAPASYLAGPVVSSSGEVLAIAYGVSSELRRFAFDGAFTPGWAAPVGVNAVSAPAIDSQGYILTGSGDGKITRVSSSGTASPPATLSGGVEEPLVVLGDGSVLAADSTGKLNRVAISGTATWAPAKTLDGLPLAPVALAGTSARVLVGTRNGFIYALADDGSTLWSTTLTGTPTLKGTNISFPSTQTPVTSTAYFSASNGKVYAVIVDGTLDTDAPWPKAFRDRRNRSNAGVPP
jgi:hypothetical protein